MDDIYLLIEGKREGPFTEEEVLQSVGWGFIPNDLPAWHWGLTDWIPVGRLMGSLLASEPAPPEQMEMVPKPVASGGSQMEELQAKVLSLSVACPYDQSNPRTCPLREVRKISLKEKREWIAKLSEMSMVDLNAFCQNCLAGKKKAKKK
ncbi:MAG: DUF4339 domain-containing protein [Methylacidiphilales bacterium]|nr:DUF4339 domain-containing protein [Candidatus Methylacidiphilales bacterium]